MTFESVSAFTDESFSVIKELLNFFRRREQIERDYSMALQKLQEDLGTFMNELPNLHPNLQKHKKPQPTLTKPLANMLANLGRQTQLEAEFNAVPDNTFTFSKSSLFRSLVAFAEYLQMEVNIHDRQGQVLADNLVNPLQNFFKLAEEFSKAFYDDASKIAKDAAHNPSVRVQADVTKAMTVEQKSKMSNLLQEFATHEQQRSQTIKTSLLQYSAMTTQMLIEYLECSTNMDLKLAQADVENDMQAFLQQHVYDQTNDKLSNVAFEGFLEKMNPKTEIWSNRYFVLKSDQRRLYYMDGPASSKILGYVDFHNAQVYPVDDSLLKSNCFVLVVPKQREPTSEEAVEAMSKPEFTTESLYFSAPSITAKFAWVQALSKYCMCCQSCSRNGFESSAPHYQRYGNDGGTFHVVRQIKLNISKGKEIQPAGDAQCLIRFDQVDMAKTAVRPGSAPLWNENFFFTEVSHAFSSLTIIVYTKPPRSGSKRESIEVGKVHFNIQLAGGSEAHDGWFYLIPSIENNVDNPGQIAVNMSVEELLVFPLEDYNPVWSHLIDDSFTNIWSIGNLIGENDASLLALLHVFEASGGNENVLLLLCRMVSKEVSQTEDPKLLFRSNGFVARLMERYLKRIGRGYIIQLLRPIVSKVLESDNSLEIDPTKVRDLSVIEENKVLLLSHVENLWAGIVNSLNMIPREYREIFAEIAKSVDAKQFSDKLVKYRSISGMLFLRLIVPALVNPVASGVVLEQPNRFQMRALLLIGKSLQSFANLATKDRGKEEYMQEIVGTITIRHSVSLMEFIDAVVMAPPPGMPYIPSQKVNLTKELAIISRHLVQGYDTLVESNKTDPDQKFSDMLKEILKLKEKTQTYSSILQKDNSGGISPTKRLSLDSELSSSSA